MLKNWISTMIIRGINVIIKDIKSGGVNIANIVASIKYSIFLLLIKKYLNCFKIMGVIKIKDHIMINWLINCIKCWKVNAIFKYCDCHCIKKIKKFLIAVLVEAIGRSQSKNRVILCLIWYWYFPGI